MSRKYFLLALFLFFIMKIIASRILYKVKNTKINAFSVTNSDRGELFNFDVCSKELMKLALMYQNKTNILKQELVLLLLPTQRGLI